MLERVVEEGGGVVEGFPAGSLGTLELPQGDPVDKEIEQF